MSIGIAVKQLSQVEAASRLGIIKAPAAMWPFSNLKRIQASTKTVGSRLAAEVADVLDAGKRLHYTHRDYCGMGLCKDGQIYVYSEVLDGDIVRKADLNANPAPPPGERREFSDRGEFILWLQAQTDLSLSGTDLPNAWLHNNQRLTVARLQEFVANSLLKPNSFRDSA